MARHCDPLTGVTFLWKAQPVLLALLLVAAAAVALIVPGFSRTDPLESETGWWGRRPPNRWVGMGTMGSAIFGVGFLLRWIGPQPAYDLALFGLSACISVALLILGLLLARRSSSD